MRVSTSRKRKRPVTSCGECYRRKQKCDREHPCTICVNRGISDRCTYGENNDFEINEDIPAPSLDLGVQTGYSAEGGNSFSMLKKSLHRQEGTDCLNSGTSDDHVPDFVLYQILDLERGLPPRSLHFQLVDVFFNEWWWWFSSLEPVSFHLMLDKWHKLDVRDRTKDGKDYAYFSALLFQVLAIALQYLQEDAASIRTELGLRQDTRSADLLSVKYSKIGMQLMDILGRQNTCDTAIQHDMLRGIWLKNFSRGSEGWHSLANAIRQAQELGIHREFPPVAGSYQDERRGRIWMGLFSWDAHVALTLARPRIINAGDCVRVPPALFPTRLDFSGQSPVLSNDFLRSLSVSPLLFNYSLAYMIHEMINLKADKPGLEDFAVLDKLHKDMDDLLDQMSPYFRATNPDTSWDKKYKLVLTMRLHLASVANTYLVSLHRAHVLRRTKSCDAAVIAALRVLQMQEQLIQIVDKQKWRIYTYSFYSIDASIFLASLFLEKPDTLKKTWYSTIEDKLESSLERLEMMQESSPMARAGAQMLRRCHNLLERQNHAVDDVTAHDLHDHSKIKSDTIVNGDAKSVANERRPLSMSESAPTKLWIEQMDLAMQPILEGGLSGPFSDELWETLLDG